LKNYKVPGSNQIPAELIQAGGETSWPEIHKLINSIRKKEELLHQWKKSIIVPIYKKDNKTDGNIYHGVSLLSTSYNILLNILLSRLVPYIDKLLEIINVGFDVTDQLLIRFSAFVKYWRKNVSTMRQSISYPQTSRKPMIQ
jgi:hypothetical protein